MSFLAINWLGAIHSIQRKANIYFFNDHVSNNAVIRTAHVPTGLQAWQKLQKHICFTMPSAATQLITKAIALFECTPVNIGEVWPLEYLFLQIQNTWPFGHSCQSQYQVCGKNIKTIEFVLKVQKCKKPFTIIC